jgi:4-hydroxy-tetrahydrodipicolinate reductase
MAIKVSVVGATGRMGKLALEVIEAASELEKHSALSSSSSLEETLGADVIFDVTRLEVSQRTVAFALANEIPVLVGTSGWSAAHLATLSTSIHGSKGTVVVVPNFSVGSMLATRFAAQAAKYFDSIEIIESHHANKVDSPSGTAIRTAELIAANRKGSPPVVGAGQTARGELVAGIPVHSIRLEGVSAKQDVRFGGSSELLTISHETTSLEAYAVGVKLSLVFAASAKGLHVGLDAVIL